MNCESDGKLIVCVKDRSRISVSEFSMRRQGSSVSVVTTLWPGPLRYRVFIMAGELKAAGSEAAHSLLPFLLSHLELPSPGLDLIPSTTVHHSLLLLSCRTFLTTTLHGPHGKHRCLLSIMRFYWSVT
jgi:hypothetical protein